MLYNKICIKHSLKKNKQFDKYFNSYLIVLQKIKLKYSL